ncbi:MAG: group 1 truncated hemoglobin [Proteobacteria bacterium]|nr:group 1 truncated hemoglobin [Pseudomonadota bacterium]
MALFITEPCRASSLYERMGGAANVAATINDVVDHAASDPRTRRSFEDVNLQRIKSSLAVLICELSGGGCKYTEDSMRDVHAGLRITQAEFYSLVQIYRDALVRHGIRLRERNELLALLAPMKRDIVEK